MSTEGFDAKANAKIDQWERKLLDLSLRNSLLNMKFSGTVVPVFAHSPAILEDKLAQDIDFSIRSRGADDKEEPEEKEETPAAEETGPEEPAPESNAAEAPAEPQAQEKPKKQTIPVREYDFENLPDITGFEELITKSFEKKKLYSPLTRSELDTVIKKLYRSAKVALEENGANTLYLALGVMKWFDRGSTTPHYAPLVLIPVELVRKSIVLGYVIRRRDEDPIINVTLLEKLKQDFGIVSDPAEIFVSDESGIDIDKVTENFRRLMTGQEGWEIYNSCVIGMFSFTNFVMWNDLRARRDTIGENKIVRSLLEGRVCWEAEPMTVPDKLDESDCFLPINADSSQLYAIKCATAGQSFVLHGPPGTGKSQTITSMVADMLAHGKKVLFVAEKKAALDVVYSRLDKIGLAPFCLELHSNKAKKAAFLQKLKEAVDIAKKTGKGDYEKSLKELADRRKELDGYCTALHEDRKCGFSLFELISIYTVNSSAPDIAAFDERLLDIINKDTYRECELALESLISAGNAIGDVSYLSSVRSSEYTQKLKSDIPVHAQELKDATAVLEEAYSKFISTLSGANIVIPGINDGTIAQARRASEISALIAGTDNMPSNICALDDYEALFRDVALYNGKKDLAYGKEQELLISYKPEFMNLDIPGLTAELNEAKSKSLFKSMAVSKVLKKVAPYKTQAAKDDQLAYNLNLASEVKALKAECDKIFSERLASYFPREFVDDKTRSDSFISSVRSIFAKLDEYDRTKTLRKIFAANSSYATIWGNMTTSYYRFDSAHSVIEEEAGIRAAHDDETFEFQYQLSDDLIGNIESLKDRVMFNKASGDCRSKGLVNVVNAYGDKTVSSEDLIPAFRKAFTKLLITNIIDSDETLRNFSGKIFEERVAQYKRLNDEFTTLTRQEVYLRIAKSLPDLTQEAQKDSKLGILQHAIKSGGRGVSIRTLFSKIPNLITALCPCVLMSPISVAQYLEPRAIKFDTVIFDEASQLPTCKAVGVIARADNAIIVGDPNQMPPTSFFQNSNFDEENYEIEDLESILDDCLALSMPGTHLLWHYRSKHESLITYSNRAFYDNRLYTFPSSNDIERKVTFVPACGTFDRGKTRTNRKEAEMVADEIVKRIKEDPSKSLGVVTFNISQQNLIDDLVMERCKKEPEIEEALFGGDEPVFIKNLENVQGDERDVILFSVGYGTDEEGKVYMNFGPLSMDGGWRRLNVAVTRARYEMVVFSSLEPEQIRVDGDTARGVAAFRSFLEYAQGRSVWENSATTVSEAPVIDRFDDFNGVADDICTALAEAGYKTGKMIGSSDYKVDIGVIDPENEGRYCLGILLDGKFYYENKTTSGREIYQPSVLTGLGWQIMRVWSVDWWENKKRVTESIIARIDEIMKKRAEEAAAAETAEPAAEDPAAEDPLEEVTAETVPAAETAVAEAAAAPEEKVAEAADPEDTDEGKKKLNPEAEENT
ncbi:MAG: DUF4011 domain-containing protein [Saccharofermentans sp.]|nr:DUF4011 domain-containing protein [Saccharofermentans sp.]